MIVMSWVGWEASKRKFSKSYIKTENDKQKWMNEWVGEDMTIVFQSEEESKV